MIKIIVTIGGKGDMVGRLPVLVLVLLFLVTPAASLNPVMVKVVVSSSNQYLTADGRDTADITVTVRDGNGVSLRNADVVLQLTSPWTLKDVQGKTKNDGTFVTTFLPTTKAGNAVITATVTAQESPTPVRVTSTQEIVATDPETSSSFYNGTATVGSITGVSFLVTDRYGNPVSSKKKENRVVFNTSLTADTGFLVPAPSAGTSGGKVRLKGLSVPLDESGYAVALFQVGTRPGDNYIVITPPPPLSQSIITIRGISNAPPASVVPVVSPAGNPPTINTDRNSRFAIDYRLLDQWGNPAAGQPLSISVNTGETMVITSNQAGNVSITYGPKTTAGRYTITATALNNPAATASQTLQFLSLKPDGIILTATPQTMASRDVKPDMAALVMAKVVDDMGNPVPGQTVSFSIQSVTLKNNAVQTEGPPSLRGDRGQTSQVGEEVSAVTDGSGYAVATFSPGGFAPRGTTNFVALAEGVARIQARWDGRSQALDLSYKNYPYLSISTSVSPPTVERNETVEVSVRVKGDGYALQPPPVDVFMVTDRSFSMLRDYPDRMIQVMGAEKAFSDQFDYTRDRLGQYSFASKGQAWANGTFLFPFRECGMDDTTGDDQTYAQANYPLNGRVYDDYATRDLPLSMERGDIAKAISGLVPSPGTPMRYALYRAITDLKNNGNSGSQKAIVILSDGDYNWYGDPLARGSACDYFWSYDGTYGTGWHQETRWPCPDVGKDLTAQSYYSFPDLSREEQNLSYYAAKNNIRIFVIGYSGDVTAAGQVTLRTLANTTGGKYFYALTGTDLVNFYTQIAGALKDTAGVNTTLAMDFRSVNVNNIPVTPGSKAIRYMFIDGKSTRVTRPNRTWETVDSTADWNMGRINLSLGTVRVNEEWVVNFTLNMTMNGTIRLLGPSSQVSFQDARGTMSSVALPDTFVTAIPEGMEKGILTPKLTLSDLSVATTGTDRDYANLDWHIDYRDGRDTAIREEIEVAPLNSDAYWYVGTRTVPAETTSDAYPLRINTFAPGVYKVRVTGYVNDADSSSTENQMTITMVMGTPKILIS